MASTKMRPNEVGRFEHPRQTEMFTAGQDGRIEDDSVSHGDGSDPGGDYGSSGDDEAKERSEGGVQVHKHEFLMIGGRGLCPRCGLYHISKNHDCMPNYELEDQRCRFCKSGGLQFVHGHYHCPRCGMANLTCCDGEVVCE